MAQRTRANGQKRLENAAENLEKEFGRLQKQFRTSRRRLERRIEKGGRQIVADIRKTPVFKRADRIVKDAEKRATALRKDAEKQLETSVDSVLSFFQVASKRDVNKLNRQLKSLNKKVTELSKTA